MKPNHRQIAAKTRRDPRARWWAFTERGPNCWRWLGIPNASGYGCLRVGGRTTLAHRFGFEMLVGPIPAGLELDHLCRNRWCVNPAHLEPVTGRENWARGTSPSVENAKKVHCVRGHALVEANLVPSKRHAGRFCLQCSRDRAREWRVKMAAIGAPVDARGRLRSPRTYGMRGEEYCLDIESASARCARARADRPVARVDRARPGTRAPRRRSRTTITLVNSERKAERG